MPDRTLNSGIRVYHAILNRFVSGSGGLTRSLNDILTVQSHDRGDSWASTRRFARKTGGKYFSSTPEGAIAECEARIRSAGIRGLSPADLQPVAIFEVAIKSTPTVLSVAMARDDDACRVDFLTRYQVAPSDTLDVADRNKSVLASHAVSNQLDLAMYAGIEYPSVRLATATNYVLHTPGDHVDFAQSSANPVRTHTPVI